MCAPAGRQGRQRPAAGRAPPRPAPTEAPQPPAQRLKGLQGGSAPFRPPLRPPPLKPACHCPPPAAQRLCTHARLPSSAPAQRPLHAAALPLRCRCVAAALPEPQRHCMRLPACSAAQRRWLGEAAAAVTGRYQSTRERRRRVLSAHQLRTRSHTARGGLAHAVAHAGARMQHYFAAQQIRRRTPRTARRAPRAAHRPAPFNVKLRDTALRLYRERPLQNPPWCTHV